MPACLDRSVSSFLTERANPDALSVALVCRTVLLNPQITAR